MGVMKRLHDTTLFRYFPICSSFSHKFPQGSPVDMGCSAENKTHVAAVNVVQVSAIALQCFVPRLYDFLC